MPKHLSDDLKLRAVQHYINTSNNYDKTSIIFDVPATSLKRWVERYNKTGDLRRLKPTRTSYKVTTVHVKEAIKQLKTTKSIAMKDLNEKLKEVFDDYDITSQWLGHVLRDNNQTRKRSRHKHEPKTRFKKPIDMKEEANKFYKKVKEYNINDIICLDETSVSPFMLNSYSRCKLGLRYLPYNPQSNSIENVFSELKHYLSSGTTRTYDELEKEIKRFFDKVILKNII